MQILSCQQSTDGPGNREGTRSQDLSNPWGAWAEDLLNQTVKDYACFPLGALVSFPTCP